MVRQRRLALPLVTAALLVACNAIIGVDGDYDVVPDGGSSPPGTEGGPDGRPTGDGNVSQPDGEPAGQDAPSGEAAIDGGPTGDADAATLAVDADASTGDADAAIVDAGFDADDGDRPDAHFPIPTPRGAGNAPDHCSGGAKSHFCWNFDPDGGPFGYQNSGGGAAATESGMIGDPNRCLVTTVPSGGGASRFAVGTTDCSFELGVRPATSGPLANSTMTFHFSFMISKAGAVADIATVNVENRLYGLSVYPEGTYSNVPAVGLLDTALSNTKPFEIGTWYRARIELTTPAGASGRTATLFFGSTMVGIPVPGRPGPSATADHAVIKVGITTTAATAGAVSVSVDDVRLDQVP